MINIIAAISYFIILGVSVWVASEHEVELARVRRARRLAQ